MSGFEIGTDGPQVIVVGIDGSDTSLRATAYAWGLARRQGSRLVFVFAASSNTITTFLPDATASAIMAGQEVATDLIERVSKVSETIHPPVPYTFRVEQGDAASMLIRVADEVRADAVVVGASVQAGHRIMGSVAIRLVRVGRWPVTVVP